MVTMSAVMLSSEAGDELPGQHEVVARHAGLLQRGEHLVGALGQAGEARVIELGAVDQRLEAGRTLERLPAAVEHTAPDRDRVASPRRHALERAGR